MGRSICPCRRGTAAAGQRLRWIRTRPGWMNRSSNTWPAATAARRPGAAAARPDREAYYSCRSARSGKPGGSQSDIKEIRLKRSVVGFVGITAALAALAGCHSSVQRAAGVASPSSLPFEAKFETAGDFYDRFDYGYSGQNPFDWPVGEQVLSYHGDHDMNCGGPTTSRPVAFGGDREHLDFSEPFWYCAPGGDGTKGHMMTGVNTTAYNIAWFSPKPEFSAVSKVCWDVNETTMSRRKWTQVVFVPHADAVRYPVGSPGPPTRSAVQQTRGTGGFDLGYVSPEFADPAGASTTSSRRTAARLGSRPSRAGRSNGGRAATSPSRPRRSRSGLSKTRPPGTPIASSRPRRGPSHSPSRPRRHRVSSRSPVRSRKARCGSCSRMTTTTRPRTAPPENPEGTYDPNAITWHWDNIQIHAGSAS